METGIDLEDGDGVGLELTDLDLVHDGWQYAIDGGDGGVLSLNGSDGAGIRAFPTGADVRRRQVLALNTLRRWCLRRLRRRRWGNRRRRWR